MVNKPFKYQPKGSMCASCKKQKNNCSDLPFRQMKPMSIYFDKSGTRISIVKCEEFKHHK